MNGSDKPIPVNARFRRFLGTRRESVVSIAAVLLLAAAPTQARVFTFDIEPQPADSALLQLAEVAELQILFSPKAIEEAESPGLKGTLPAREALEATLAGTGLVYEFKSEDFVVVMANANSRTKGDGEENFRNRAASAGGNTVRLAELQETAQEEVSADPARSDDEEETTEEIVVVGSRLEGMETASPVITIDSQTIERGGYANLEDVFRRLPQNLSSITAASHDVGQAVEFADTLLAVPRVPLGNSSINLRGLGSRSTLILVNGRRRAASAQASGGFTDISSIPLSQIERIEILTDGASAIYGTDAVAGVVNIILKRKFKGASMQIRYENSGTDGHLSRLAGAYSLNWSSGYLTTSIDASRHSPVDSNKLIHVGPSGRGDFTDLGGINARLRPHGSPGAVFEAMLVPWIPFYALTGSLVGLIPEGQDGTNLLETDLIDGDADSRSVYERRTIGPDIEKTALRMYASQDLGASHELYFEVSYTKQTDEQFWRPSLYDFSFLTGSRTVLVPKTNPFNRIGRDVVVGYSFENEFKHLLFSNEGEQKNIQASIGFRGNLPFRKDWKYTLDYSYGQEDSFWKRLADFTGVRGRGEDDPTIRVRPVLNGLNVFGDGSYPEIVAANVALLATLVEESERDAKSDVTSIEATLGGELFRLPGGAAQLVIGAQRRDRDNKINVPMPRSREVGAYFAEIGLPLAANRPGIEDLQLTFAVRREEIEQSGVASFFSLYRGPSQGIDLEMIAGIPEPPRRRTNELTGSSEFSSTPVIATLSWYPIENLRLRTTWGESFQAPLEIQQYNQVLSRNSTLNFRFSGLTLPEGFTEVYELRGGNLFLEPQEAQTLTFGFDFLPKSIPGLDLRATYTKTEYDNFIGNFSTVVSNPAARTEALRMLEDIASFPEVFIPGENGVLIFDGREKNFADRTSETIDLQANYELDTGLGSWVFRLNLQKMLELSTRTSDVGRLIEFHDTESGPSDLAGNFAVEWARGNYRITSILHYLSGHRVLTPQSSVRSALNDIPNPNPQTHATPYTTVDLQLRYVAPPGSSWLSGLDIALGAQDLFEADFPFVDNLVGYSASRVNPRGRVLYLALNKEFGGR